MDVQVQRKVVERDYHVIVKEASFLLCSLCVVDCLSLIMWGMIDVLLFFSDLSRCNRFVFSLRKMSIMKLYNWCFYHSVRVCEVVVFILCCIQRPLHLF